MNIYDRCYFMDWFKKLEFLYGKIDLAFEISENNKNDITKINESIKNILELIKKRDTKNV